MKVARRAKSLTISRSKKVLNFAYIKEKYLRTEHKKKADKHKVMSRFNTELRWQAEIEVQTLRELHKKAAMMSRKQNTRRRVKWRAEVTQEERIQDPEINAANQRVSRKRLELRFVGIAKGELEVSQEAQLHQVPPVEEICQFF